MSRWLGPVSPSHVSLRTVAAGALLAPLCASPAAAEVCDKVEEGSGNWLGLVLVLASAAFVSARAFGRTWPAVLAAAIMFLLVEPTLYGLLRQEPVALAAWREGCGRNRLVLDVGVALALIALGWFGRRRFQARSASDRADAVRSEEGKI
jgi:hypothetical protein